MNDYWVGATWGRVEDILTLSSVANVLVVQLDWSIAGYFLRIIYTIIQLLEKFTVLGRTILKEY